MTPVPNPITFAGWEPKVAVDADGKPYVLYGTSSSELHLTYWDGRAPKNSAVTMSFTGNSRWPQDLVVTGAPGTDLILRPTVEFLLDTGGSNVTYARTTDLVSWSGRAGTAPDIISTNGYDLSSRHPSFSFELVAGPAPQVDIIYSTGTGLGVATPIAGGWTTRSLLAGVYTKLKDAAAWQSGVLYGLEPGGATNIATTAYTFTMASGEQQLFRTDLGGRVGSAYAFAVVNDVNNAYSGLVLCSPTPATGSSWKQTQVFLPLNEDATYVATALSPTSFAVAIVQSSGLVFFSTANDGCVGGPSTISSWSAPIQYAGSPALAFGPGGTLWKVYTDGGGSVVLTH